LENKTQLLDKNIDSNSVVVVSLVSSSQTGWLWFSISIMDKSSLSTQINKFTPERTESELQYYT